MFCNVISAFGILIFITFYAMDISLAISLIGLLYIGYQVYLLWTYYGFDKATSIKINIEEDLFSYTNRENKLKKSISDIVSVECFSFRGIMASYCIISFKDKSTILVTNFVEIESFLYKQKKRYNYEFHNNHKLLLTLSDI